MTHLQLSSAVHVQRSPEDVFAYAADFRRAAEWREEVVESTMSPDGPMRVGSILHEVAHVAGRTVVTDSVVDAIETPDGYSFSHLRGALPVSGEYRVVAGSDGGAELRYDLRVELRGGWALLAPLLAWTGPRMLARSLDEFRFRLEAAAVQRVAATKH